MTEHMLQKSKGKQTDVNKVVKQHWPTEHGQVVDDLYPLKIVIS